MPKLHIFSIKWKKNHKQKNLKKSGSNQINTGRYKIKINHIYFNNWKMLIATESVKMKKTLH